MLAVKLTLSSFAVRAREVLVTCAADILECLDAVAVSRAAVCAVDAERGLAVAPAKAIRARAFAVLARAIITVRCIALERTCARAASVIGRSTGEEPRRRLRVHTVHLDGKSQPESGRDHRGAQAGCFLRGASHRPRHTARTEQLGIALVSRFHDELKSS